jgi:hypothetical protein
VIFGSDETRRPRIFRADVPNERVWLLLVKETYSEIKGQSGDQVKIYNQQQRINSLYVALYWDGAIFGASA